MKFDSDEELGSKDENINNGMKFFKYKNGHYQFLSKFYYLGCANENHKSKIIIWCCFKLDEIFQLQKKPISNNEDGDNSNQNNTQRRDSIFTTEFEQQEMKRSTSHRVEQTNENRNVFEEGFSNNASLTK